MRNFECRQTGQRFTGGLAFIFNFKTENFSLYNLNGLGGQVGESMLIHKFYAQFWNMNMYKHGL